jgi:hypothetical protein
LVSGYDNFYDRVGALPNGGTGTRIVQRAPGLRVPIYSHVYYGDRERTILLTGILSVRNTDPGHGMTLLQVDYYDSEGKLLRKYLTQPVTLGPLGATRFIVKTSDAAGGSGAKFLVRWKAESPVNEPILEGVMIGASGQQGISFTSRGVAIMEK